MSKYKNVILVFFLPLLYLSCKPTDSQKVHITYYLNVAPTSYQFLSGGGDLSISVSAKKTISTMENDILVNRVVEDSPYEIVADRDWLSVKDTIITATANTTLEIREGNITIKLKEATNEVSIKITQRGEPLASTVPLPAGKKNYTLAYGRLSLTDSTWVKLSNFEFSESGTFRETYWYWSTSLRKGKAFFATHSCTMDGVTGPVTVYTPTGWIKPAEQSKVVEGTYHHDVISRKVELLYPGGHTLTWRATEVTGAGGVGRMDFVSTSNDATHGVGLGSNADWSEYKTLAEVPRIMYYGKAVSVMSIKKDDPKNSLKSSWYRYNLPLDLYTFSDDNTVLHYHQPKGSQEPENPTYKHTGHIYHLASTNTSRQMIWNNYMSVLAGDAFPTYNKNLHPHALMQVINDKGELKGFVKIEQQNPPEPAYDNNYQYVISYWLDKEY